MKRLILIVTIAAALIASTAATAATIQDLTGLGYTVSASSQCDSGGGVYKTVWYVSGFGVGTYASECDPGFQAQIDSLANPTGQCNRVWQINHPDQLTAFQSISGKGWALSGDQCADSYTVTNPNDSTVAYSGSGAGLPAFNDSHGNPPAAQVTPGAGQSAAAPAPTPTPGNCLPLCPNVGDTRGDGGVLIPGGGVLVPASAIAPAAPLTSTSAVAPITDPAVAPTAAAILFPDNSTGYLVRAGYGYDGALTP